MKAILVIDKPENCEDCPLFRTAEDFNATIDYCMSGKGKELFMVREKGVSEKCPLKPLPQRKYYSDGEDKRYIDGYDDCVDELLGGNE